MNAFKLYKFNNYYLHTGSARPRGALIKPYCFPIKHTAAQLEGGFGKIRLITGEELRGVLMQVCFTWKKSGAQMAFFLNLSVRVEGALDLRGLISHTVSTSLN